MGALAAVIYGNLVMEEEKQKTITKIGWTTNIIIIIMIWLKKLIIIIIDGIFSLIGRHARAHYPFILMHFQRFLLLLFILLLYAPYSVDVCVCAWKTVEKLPEIGISWYETVTLRKREYIQISHWIWYIVQNVAINILMWCDLDASMIMCTINAFNYELLKWWIISKINCTIYTIHSNQLAKIATQRCAQHCLWKQFSGAGQSIATVSGLTSEDVRKITATCFGYFCDIGCVVIWTNIE